MEKPDPALKRTLACLRPWKKEFLLVGLALFKNAPVVINAGEVGHL